MMGKPNKGSPSSGKVVFVVQYFSTVAALLHRIGAGTSRQPRRSRCRKIDPQEKVASLHGLKSSYLYEYRWVSVRNDVGTGNRKGMREKICVFNFFPFERVFAFL